MKYIRKVLASLRKADETFGLIDQGDRIVVGISGGKDSLCLLEALSIYGKFSHKDFTILPVMLDLGFEGFDPSKVVEWTKTLGLTLHVEDSREVAPILFAHQKEGHHIPCSICSRMKKAAINAVARKLKANKVAFAHHKDDAVETLFMNMIHGGRAATFEPKMVLDRAKITFIRPLILASENDLVHMAKEECLPVTDSHCPANGFTERQYVKEMLSDLYKNRAESEKNFQSLLTNYEDFGLYFNHLEYVAEYSVGFAFKPLINAEDALRYNDLALKHKGLTPLKSGMKTYLILKRHQVVGRVSYRSPNPHEVDILCFEMLGRIQEKENVLRSFLSMEAKKANPILFQIQGANRAAAIRVGFAKNPRYAHLVKKVIR